MGWAQAPSRESHFSRWSSRPSFVLSKKMRPPVITLWPVRAKCGFIASFFHPQGWISISFFKEHPQQSLGGFCISR